jgi:glycosidase
MSIIHELQHRAIDQANVVAAAPAKRHGDALAVFEESFPSRTVYSDRVEPGAYLQATTDGAPNRQLSTEELLLLWVANRNPAFMRYDDLFDEHDLAASTDYPRIVAEIRKQASRDTTRTGGKDLVERLLEPAREAPDSLAGQLRWIRDNWADIVDDDLLQRLTWGLDVLAEERVAADHAWFAHAGGGGDTVESAALAGFGGHGEPESFSQDLDWMPGLVLMAKSTYVWLDQLSRVYGRAIRTLDGIPDEELDRLSSWGFTGLWLIGLWERSHASQRIKQLQGNPDAVASAYSLMDYRIADDLGGEAAWRDLRDRAWARGIRLASDMVPNHMGIDSRWVTDHPEYFVSRDDSPYPSYSWTGPNLSRDERVGIYLEDHYTDSSDAAVVFKRVDRWSGATRYIYHGNDGTSFPWNDTAQLDYLRADVREAVIRTIIDVARRFPVIRFDAAMVLARKHVQRLWYPLPGSAGAIPSRAEYALTQAQFDAAMPAEFWREVVDRVATEAPDTLLLAEAFWLLEGYFVRTLGMHRVYNSAFMHMLRDEDNAGYRSVIRETVGFDPRILGRYVNFMNNPDERTAIDQFGSGDKYVGVATLLATLPGLPMFGHGQVEGFGEKYGMEFRRAMLDEVPDASLIGRHEREIFPLLRQRWRFAAADEFRMLDAIRGDGSVDDDVYAYTNHVSGSRSLVVYRNKFSDGRVRITGAGATLGVPDDGSAWLVLRDLRTGLEHLRNCHDIHSQGLELDLHAYQSHVFLDPSVVWDDAAGDWGRLAWRIGLSGVPDVQAALRDQLLEPARLAVDSLFQASVVRDVAGAGLAPAEETATTLIDTALQSLAQPLEAIARAIGATAGRGASVDTVRSAVARRLVGLVSVVRAGRAATPSRSAAARRAAATPAVPAVPVASPIGTSGAAVDDPVRLAAWVGTDRARWATLVGWAVGTCLGDLVGATTPGAVVGVFDAWAAGPALTRVVGELGMPIDAASRVAVLVRSMLAVPVGALTTGDQVASLTTWLQAPAVRAATGWNQWQSAEFVFQQAFDEWLEALAATETAAGLTGGFARASALAALVVAHEFRVDALVAPMESDTSMDAAAPTDAVTPAGD